MDCASRQEAAVFRKIQQERRFLSQLMDRPLYRSPQRLLEGRRQELVIYFGTECSTVWRGV